MKILVICQYYYPEPFRIPDICEELVKKGHKVTVVTGTPNYPMGEIYEGYEKGKRKYETINGVKVHRCFTIGRKGGTIKRFLNYYSYAISSSLHILLLKNDYDVVFVNQLSPVMMAYAGILYKKLHHKKLVMYCLDLWPASLCAGGVKESSVIYKVFHKISANIYKQADKILITSSMFKKYLHDEFGINKRKISYLPQYAEDLFDPEKCKKAPNGWIDLMFAGNIGKVQNVEIILKAAKELKMKKIRFHIVGDGTDVNRLISIKEKYQLNNVIFHGRQPLEDMPKYYSMADAMLVTMEDDSVLNLTLPGKVQTYMAAGKPIIGSIKGETDYVIRRAQCGFVGRPNSTTEFVLNINNFIKYNNKQTLVENARGFYDDNFSKSSFLHSIESIIKKL